METTPQFVGQQLVEEIQAILVERVKEARENILRGHWEVGETLRRYEKEQSKSITLLVKEVAGTKVASESTLWTCAAIFDKFPVFESVYETPLGLNISLNKVKQLLAGPKAECPHSEHERVTRCKKCHTLV